MPGGLRDLSGYQKNQLTPAQFGAILYSPCWFVRLSSGRDYSPPRLLMRHLPRTLLAYISPLLLVVLLVIIGTWRILR